MQARTENGILECVIASHATIQQIYRILVTQIRGYGVHTRPATAFGAAGIDVQHRVPGLSFLTGLHIRRRGIILDAMFAAEYVKVTENNARDVRRSVRLPVFTLNKKDNS